MNDVPFRTWFHRQLAIRDWTQSEFSRKANVSTNVVSQWVTGKRSPSPESCRIIADTFFVPYDEVLKVAGVRPLASNVPEHVARFSAMLDRIVWTPDRINGLGSLLESWIEFDRRSVGR